MLKVVSSLGGGGGGGGPTYLGTWNAATNTPTLASGVGTTNNYYIVSTAGSTNLDGETLWGVGDWVIFNGTTWQKIDGGDTSTVTSLVVTTLTGYMYANASSAVTASTTIPVSAVTGAVSSVTGTSPVLSSGGTTPAISLASNYGDTQNPYASKTANYFLASPNGSAGVPTFRAVVAADIPTLNQNTTGTSGGLTGTSGSTATFATSSLPLVPEGYLTVNINGSNKKIPYYGV